MRVNADDERVEQYSEDGQLDFSVRWSDIQRINAWRMSDGELCYLMLEIAPDPVTGTSPLFVNDEEAAWQGWIDAFTKYVPGFTKDLVRSALDLPEGESAVHILVRDFQEAKDDDSATSSFDAALYDWLDELYQANEPVFRQPETASPAQGILICVYNFQAELLNGGWQQYFGNSTADDLSNLRRVLRKIGASSALNLLKTACDLFPRGSPGRTQETRIRQLEKMSAKRRHTMEKLDEEVENMVEDTIAKLKAYLERAIKGH